MCTRGELVGVVEFAIGTAEWAVVLLSSALTIAQALNLAGTAGKLRARAPHAHELTIPLHFHIREDYPEMRRFVGDWGFDLLAQGTIKRPGPSRHAKTVRLSDDEQENDLICFDDNRNGTPDKGKKRAVEDDEEDEEVVSSVAAARLRLARLGF
ncbi:hypothetical protein DFH08DRAFT_824032 [Mycena albidolilacea]|uniref:Uncharacterized protein n=1 Tax=Mycena albidolilacea TaxID=1033008 RepID=A0AAD6Z679_9AGAR|nr:hypothetical protein DFH08DRAFT_824032 [Mycena albidolilacea]